MSESRGTGRAAEEGAPDGTSRSPAPEGGRIVRAGQGTGSIVDLLRVDAGDPAPAYVQIQRRIRLAVADGALAPGQRLPSVRDLSRALGVSNTTVGRAYASLAREGVLVGRAGGGSEVAPLAREDFEALGRVKSDRLKVLARQVAVRGLALGVPSDEIMSAVARELARHGQAPTGAPIGEPLGEDEVPLLSARNRLKGRVERLRGGELFVEVTLALPEGTRVRVAITREAAAALGLREGASISAYVKTTAPVLGA